jgi:glycosyltransferase involved in cell wall biosynthesis
LYVSHLEGHKDVATAVEMGRSLAAAGTDFRLFLTLDRRDGPKAFDALLARIHANGLRDKIVNLGRVPESQVYHLYRQCDVFFFPSLCESFGFPMKEALGVGLPIVASDTLVNRELCGDAAEYFEPRDADQAAAAVRRLLLDPALRQAMAGRARRRYAASTLDWKQYATALLALMHRVRGTDHVG